MWIGLILLVPSVGISQKVAKDSLKNTRQPIIVTDSTVNIIADSVKAGLTKEGKKKFTPVPKRATRLALIPGGGQLYNRDYWKLPIIYLALGGGGYTYYLNSIKYKDFLTAYKQFYDEKTGALLPGLTVDSTRIVRVRNLLGTQSTYVAARRDAIERQKNYWRRNRNLAIIASGLIYTLTIIEANVAAHLKTFDLSDDLTLKVGPKFSQPYLQQPAPGLRLVFNFK